MYDSNSDKSSSSEHSDQAEAGRRPLPLSGRYQIGEAEQVDVYGILNELLELPDKARKLPGNVLVGFNHERFGHLVLKIRANLPEDMKRARRLTRDTEKIVGEAKNNAKAEIDRARAEAERIVSEGRSQADGIVRDAREEAGRLVEHSEICRMAEAQAREIVHNANGQAEGIQAEAEDYARKVQSEAEDYATKVRCGAQDYARDVLANLEGVLSNALATVRRGREALDQARDGDGL